MAQVNPLAVLVAGVLGFLPGALWYSPLLFLNRWAAEIGLDLTRPRTSKHGFWQLPVGLAVSLAAATVFALLLGPAPTLGHAIAFAVACAGGLVATSFAIQYLFEGRSLAFWLINASYHLVQFLLYALVLALWP